MKMASKDIKDIKEHFKARKGKNKRGRKKENVLPEDEPGTSQAADNKDLQLLREFDLDFKYGPSSGLTRLERWERAAKFNLDPPQNVLQIIKHHEKDPAYTNNVWADYCI